MGRRTGLAAAAAVVLVGVAVAVLTHDPPIELEAPGRGEVVADWLPDGTPVFVTRRDGEVWVLDARVPRWLDDGIEVHVGFCDNWLVAWEPFYVSTFDHDGEWTGGPEPGGLASYEAELADGRVRVGPRQPPPPRREGVEGDAVASGPCQSRWAGGDTVAQSHPPAVHHYQEDLGDAVAPEDVSGSSGGDPVLVLGAVERLDADTLRACAWEPSGDAVAGPLCGDGAPEVEASPFGFLAADFPGLYGSYGLYLMSSEGGRLGVEAVLPAQIEYYGEPLALPADPIRPAD